MTACKQKLDAFERAVQMIEKLDESNLLTVSDASFQALYKTYEKLTDMLSPSDKPKINNFLTLTLGTDLYIGSLSP